jgi:CRP-like cAMP-binding protein
MIQPEELKKVPIFACLTDGQRERIAQNAADLRVQKGEWLIREGEVPSFFVLLEGVLEVEKEYGGASQVRGRYQPGDSDSRIVKAATITDPRIDIAVTKTEIAAHFAFRFSSFIFSCSSVCVAANLCASTWRCLSSCSFENTNF